MLRQMVCALAGVFWLSVLACASAWGIKPTTTPAKLTTAPATTRPQTKDGNNYNLVMPERIKDGEILRIFFGPGTVHHEPVVVWEIDWNDGSEKVSVDRASGQLDHLYDAPDDYQIHITAKSAKGTAATYAFPITVVRQPPTAPSDLLAVGDVNRVNLTWNNTAPSHEGIEVEVAVDGGGFHRITTLDKDMTDYTVNTQRGHTYKIRIRAFNSAGASAWVNAQWPE